MQAHIYIMRDQGWLHLSTISSKRAVHHAWIAAQDEANKRGEIIVCVQSSEGYSDTRTLKPA